MRLSVLVPRSKRVCLYDADRAREAVTGRRCGFHSTEIRPNQFFQPPGAKTGAPLDVSDVKFVAFAPQDQAAGRFAIGRIVVSR